MLYRVQHLCEKTWAPWEAYLEINIAKDSIGRGLPQEKLIYCPGLYFLCLHPSDVVRSWAHQEVSNRGKIEGDRESQQYIALQPCYERAIHILEQDELSTKNQFAQQAKPF